MEEPSTLSAILDALAPVARAVWGVRWSSHLASLARIIVRIVALPLRLLVLPLSYLARFLLVLIAPALCILSYLLSWAAAAAAFVVSLKPLYSFFGAATAVGIVSGIALGVSSSIITSYLGMQDEPEPDEQASPKTETLDLGPAAAASPAVAEAEWSWAESSPSRRRRPAGLLSLTIHEEDDSDL